MARKKEKPITMKALASFGRKLERSTILVIQAAYKAKQFREKREAAEAAKEKTDGIPRANLPGQKP